MLLFLFQARLLSRARDGETITQAEALVNNSRVEMIGWLQIAVYLITGVLFLMWIYRAYWNLKALGARKPAYSPGWAVGYFFVPFINLVRPYEIVKEIWRGSNPDVGVSEELAKQRGLSLGQYSSTSRLVGFWWVSWLAANIINYLTAKLSGIADTPDEFLRATFASMLGDALSVIAALGAMLVIKKIDDMQEEKYARQAAPSPPRDDLVAGQPA